LVAVDHDTAARIAEADPEFAAAFNDYQREFACRALRYEIAESSLAETPELTLRLLADQVVRNYDPDDEAAALTDRRSAARERARAALVERPATDRERLERALARAERAYPVREDNEFFTVSAPLALIRYRLVSLIGRPGDGVRGRYGGLGGVSGRGGFRVSVRARERDRQLGGLSLGL
jgi:pyruvate,water dikinase